MTTQDLFSEEPGQQPKLSGPVTCLGMTFENDEARRAHFTEELRKKLQDPEFRKIEGFPHGHDEDILNLSDPPYYTACPNPWIADFIAEWEAQKPEQPEGYHYHREPFAADVSEGKNDPIYNAHSYHTKVPHKAIMRYILHYTQPGDIVFDGFCGTGMTGVAAQMCGEREVVMSLGYQVKPDGTILLEETDEDGKKVWRPFSKLGVRRAILNDLSPAATFIAYNYNTPVDVVTFEKNAKCILKEVEEELGWMYETLHTDNKTRGRINYVIWSDVFSCSGCQEEVVFLDAAVSDDGQVSSDSFECPSCKATLSKASIEKRMESVLSHDGTIVERVKKVPVSVNYKIASGRKEKGFADSDQQLLKKIEHYALPEYWPKVKLNKQKEQYKRDALHLRGIETASDFYTRRNLIALGALWKRAAGSGQNSYALRYWLTSIQWLASNMYRHRKGGGGGQQGKLTIPSLVREQNVFRLAVDKLKNVVELVKLIQNCPKSNVITTADASSAGLSVKDSIDYIFIDPPFGGNIFYSDLNSIWEGWHSVNTNDATEAVVHRVQTDRTKKLRDYAELMRAGLSLAYLSLKPGRWVTVEFSNSQASVWNVIQTSMQEAGFVVANVAALDKKQRSFRSVTSPTAVKQDLVISAYKPNGGFEERFQKEAQTEEGVWDFVRSHLKYLPVTKRQGLLLLMVPERDPRILFDQMIAFYVRKGYPVPISSQDFQIGLVQRFIERDGMYFLPDQVAEYDRKKMISGAPKQLSMFVSDEASAIQWLRQLIKEKPQTFSDINPQFMQQLGGWSKNEAQLDLRELLNQNFLCYDGKGQVPEQIHAYLSTNWKELRNLPKDDPALVTKARDRWYVPDPNKAGDLDKLREKALLKEFEEYKEVKKKLKVFRLEAVRVGFKKAWQERDYAVIVAVADKIPNNVLEEDPKLLMWYDQAVTRLGG
ncbi:Adenine specific DNA methylase Mod [Thiorhodovibrio winogradskyi]|uniref:Adenine specific DNA methylase Mod n=1 Tax=Thiorhodovibrio winogradskyi TaxID=77007 RepID=A0ABZ0S3P5_9GAMM|nr:DNA methyltransferase [Thiorhodovibrio winogradskyi]